MISKLTKYALSKAFKKECPSTIPRSGEKGAKVNCYTVSIDKNTKPYLLVGGIDNENLNCLEWDGSRYAKCAVIPINAIAPSELRITHYYGHSEVRYFGIIDFLLGIFIRYPYIKIHIARSFDTITQYFFNKKKLVTKQRIDLLKILVEKYMDGTDSVCSIGLMTELYSLKWIMHPDRKSQRRKVEFYLESLAATGELKIVTDGYAVTGLALRTIEEYEEQERKHRENVIIQRGMLLLTFVIALLTLVQSGLIKLPPLYDGTINKELSPSKNKGPA